MLRDDTPPIGITVAVMLLTTAAIWVLKKDRSFGTLTDRDAASRSKANNTKPKEKNETWESHVVTHGKLQTVWPDTLYTLEAAGASQGPPCRNMHIYRVPSAGNDKDNKQRRLVIFNGIAVDEPTIKEIEALGVPTILVVPNCYHRCCAGVWKARYPDIQVVTPACAIETASKVVKVDYSTQKWAQKEDWSPYVHTKEIDGWGAFETVLEFELEPSGNGKKAMLVCDMLFTIPYKETTGYIEKAMIWAFDSCITLPEDGSVIVPKVARLSRLFGVKDWPAAEQWFRHYARNDGPRIAAILVGHGVPIKEMDAKEGCTKSLEGVADQLLKKKW